MTRYSNAIICCLLFLLTACSKPNARTEVQQPGDGTEALSTVVSIVPQAYFVERIAGSLASVEILAPPNHTAETHQVTPRQMDTLSHADVYFRIGMPFETTLVERLSATCPQLKIVDTREGVVLLGASCTHDEHEDEHHHHHEGDDPHIWLDPMRVKIQARTVATTLTALATEHADEFKANLTDFETELDALHTHLETMLASARDRTIYVYHPAFGYLADAYGFEQRSVEIEGKSPGSKQLYELIDEIKAAHVKTIFVQPQFSDGSVRVIAEATDVNVVPINNLMSNYITGMEELARAIEASFE